MRQTDKAGENPHKVESLAASHLAVLQNIHAVRGGALREEVVSRRKRHRPEHRRHLCTDKPSRSSRSFNAEPCDSWQMRGMLFVS